jgi:hypothetical protein
MISRDVRRFFLRHPGQHTVEDVAEATGCTIQQASAACSQLVKKGFLQRPPHTRGVYEFVPRIEAQRMVQRAEQRAAAEPATFNLTPVFGDNNSLIHGELIPDGWKVLHGFIPAGATFSSASPCKHCGGGFEEWHGKVAITTGVKITVWTPHAQTSNFYHTHCIECVQPTHVYEKVFWAIGNRVDLWHCTRVDRWLRVITE